MRAASTLVSMPLAALPGLGRLEPNFLERHGIAGQLLRPRRKRIEPEQKREYIGVLFPAHFAWLIGGHGRLHLLEQVVHSLSVPIALEVGDRERRRLTAASQSVAMARRAMLAIERLASAGLLLSINAIPNRR